MFTQFRKRKAARARWQGQAKTPKPTATAKAQEVRRFRGRPRRIFRCLVAHGSPWEEGRRAKKTAPPGALVQHVSPIPNLSNPKKSNKTLPTTLTQGGHWSHWLVVSSIEASESFGGSKTGNRLKPRDLLCRPSGLGGQQEAAARGGLRGPGHAGDDPLASASPHPCRSTSKKPPQTLVWYLRGIPTHHSRASWALGGAGFRRSTVKMTIGWSTQYFHLGVVRRLFT